MAITVGDGEGGGGITPIGTAGSICSISPSDLVGTIDNLITRIEKIEEVLMQIATGNIWANQLSDLSQQVGWLGGITYMGVPGWTQTEYGSLIPPPGFTLLGNGITLSDGSTYQAVVMDENGVLQFGFTPTGGVEGELPDTWSAGAAGEQDYVIYSFSSAYSPTNPISSSRGITTDSNTFSSSVATGTIRWTVSEAGLYLASLNATWSNADATSTGYLVSYSISAGAIGLSYTDKLNHQEIKPPYNAYVTPTSFKADVNATSRVMRLAAGDKVTISATCTALSGSPPTPTFAILNTSLVRISAE